MKRALPGSSAWRTSLPRLALRWLASILLLLSLSGPLRAEDPAWYIEALVAQVSLEAVEGVLPGENLESLLNVQQGRAYSPKDVRSDLAMLFRVGQFEAIEAHIEPWVLFDEEENPIQAVAVTYRALPSPTIRKLKVEGSRAFSKRELLTVSGLLRGDAFVEEARQVETRIVSFYRLAGYLGASASVQVSPVAQAGEGRMVDLMIRVDEGQSQRTESIRLVGMPPLLERAGQRALRKAGLRDDHPFVDDQVRKGREALAELLRKEGYPRAEVRGRPLLLKEGRSVRLFFLVETGPRVDIEVRGEGLFDQKRIASLVQVESLLSISDELLGEMQERIEKDLGARGYLDARVTMDVKEQPSTIRVTVRIERGARHRLDKVHFEGAKTWSEDFLTKALREANPEVLGRRHVTAEAVDDALGQLEEFYRSQGFLSVDLERRAIRKGKRGFLGRRRVNLDIDVKEGSRTILQEIRLEGDIGPGAPVLERRSEALIQKPLNPAALDALAREIVNAYYDKGYLNADAKITREIDPGGAVAVARLWIEPGVRVYLRNVVIQGLRRTRRSVVQKEVEVETGEPITASALSKTRGNLFDLGLFKSVEPLLVGDEDRVKDLVVKVEEQRNILLDLGGGASTDEGVRTFLRATHRNLWGLAHRLSFLGQVGLGYQGEDWRLDTVAPEWRAAIHYEAPNIPGLAEVVFADALLNEEKVEPTYNISRSGAGLGLQSSIGKRGQFMMDYRVEFLRLSDVDPGALLEGDPWLPLLGVASQLDPLQGESFDVTMLGVPVTPSGYRTSSGLGCVLILDQRDDPQNPRRGARWTFQGRVNDGLLSQSNTAIAQSRLVELFPLGGLGLLFGVQGGIGGSLRQSETLALEDRFRLGGAGSLRGYEKDSVGPMNRVEAYQSDFPDEIDPLIRYARRGDPYRWVPTGGDAMLAMTAELKVPLSVIGLTRLSNAAVVGFTDAGNVFLVNERLRTTSSLEGDPLFRTGFGVGFRYATPIGPLQLDLGFNPDPKEARGEEPYRLHLSLGTL